jgi:hypothetical protein
MHFLRGALVGSSIGIRLGGAAVDISSWEIKFAKPLLLSSELILQVRAK